MAKLIELGLVLEGKEAEEFLKKDAEQWDFTTDQLDIFKDAKRVYKANFNKF